MKMNKYLCKVLAANPDTPDETEVVFEVVIRADSISDVAMMAEETVDRDIRNGKLIYPYSTADLIDCFSIQKIA
jgi:hypothetical protein